MDEFVDVWNAIMEKGRSPGGVDSLEPRERAVFRAYTFVMQLEMDGASGAIYNLSPREGSDQHHWEGLRAAADAMLFIGDEETAHMLVTLAEAFEGLPVPGPSTWEETEEIVASRLPSDWQEALDDRIRPIYDHLEAYTRAHFS